MADDNSRQWAEVAALFDRLVELSLDEREAQLKNSNASPEIQQQVRRMLSSLENDPDFLEQSGRQAKEPVLDSSSYSSLSAGARIGAFIVERLVGRGGMGEVYLAHRTDADFSQKVALKLIRPEAVGRMGHFENERRILAGLRLPQHAYRRDAPAQILVREVRRGLLRAMVDRGRPESRGRRS